ncbi:MAG: ABC transporter permease [Bacteroidota bacterium]
MIDIDKWREIFDSLFRHKLRTVLTAFSVWWGIFMLTILLGAGNGLFNSATRNFEDEAINSFWIWTNKTSIPYKGLPAGRYIQMKNDERTVVENHPKVKHASSVRWLNGSQNRVSYQNKTLDYRVVSVHPDYNQVEYFKMDYGRWINEQDQVDRRKICVIGNEVYEGIFKNGKRGKDKEAADITDPSGHHIRIGEIDYKIVGKFTKNSRSQNERIYIPIFTEQRIAGTDRISNLAIELDEVSLAESEVVEKQVRAAIAEQLRVDPEDEQAIGIHNGVQDFQNFKTVMTLIQTFIWFVGIGSIIAGVIGVSNIMLILVKERTREIGVRKALGATPRSIISMILTEALVLTGLAGYLGLACGLIIIYGIQSVMEANDVELEFFYNPEVNVYTVFAALIILVLSGLLAGLIPALQAVRINPVQAMKG